MLKSLSIKNIALISQLSLELQNGLNILSGETGAGKSIIIDSLNFVLGERADKSLIRYGTDEASVEAVFEDYSTKEISQYLEDLGVEEDSILIISRKMRDNKNECRINGKLVTVFMLKGLTSLLVDIHGQHEHQALLNVANHLTLIDSISSENLPKIKAEYEEKYNAYHEIVDELNKYGNPLEIDRNLDIVQYQIDEIEHADIQPNEEETLIEKRHKFRNAEKIINSLKGSYDVLDGYDGQNAVTQVKQAISFLNNISTFGEDISTSLERLESVKLELKDISETLNGMISEFDLSESEVDKLEDRLTLVRQIKKKYGPTEEDVFKFLEKAKDTYEMLSNADDRIAQLTEDKKKAGASLVSACEKLTKERKKISAQFEKDLLVNLKDLGMGDTTFKVNFMDIDTSDPDILVADGGDEIEFLISPNIGEPLKPLAKIISGGEMSRFMLALKNIIADKDSIGTMVFDEIDTGISGNIMTAVAQKMCRISRNHQVIAVTHMPSLTAMADVHFLIEKNVEGDKTITHVYPLNEEDDIKEIGRLIGGLNYSDYALPHAQEMKKWANDYKNSL